MPNQDFDDLRNAVAANQKLYSVFDRVSLGNAKGKLENQHDRRVLTADNIVYGIEAPASDAEKALKEDLAFLKNMEESAQTETFFHLIQKYGWRIGDPKKQGEYDLAVPFCDSFRFGKALADHKEFILVKGDLSGIQKYIYGNIQPKQAGGMVKIAKKLRGRSVIVSLLTDFLAGIVLRELELPVWNMLFAGGGHFNLLLPNSEKVNSELPKIIIKLNEQMCERFGENLQLVFAQKNFSLSEIEQEAGRCFSEVNSILEKQKQQQHKGELARHFFSPKMTPEEQKAYQKKIEDWEIAIGERFPKRKILIEAVTDGSVFQPDNEKLLEIVTFKLDENSYSLLVPEDLTVLKNAVSEDPGLVSAQVFSINNTEFLKIAANIPSSKISFGFRFLGKTVPLTIDDKTSRERPQTFEEIVEAKGDNLKILAALRLDVDDLGFIFSRGMDGARLGEIICLSREMQYFFSTHFDGLAEKHHLYLIYSGGDDAFAVGKWDDVIAFSSELQNHFKEFTKNNQDVHFSAGIFMGTPHYPVGRFYREAGNLQDAAKDATKDKNRVNIFNHIMTWDSFSSKIELGSIFFDALDNNGDDAGKLNIAFVYRILNLVKSSFHERTFIDKNDSYRIQKRGSINMERFARNVGGLRYLFARNGMDAKRANELVGKLETALIGDFLKSFDFGPDEQIKSTRDYLVALNYALYKKRAKPNKQ
jgi:CRISPR-associated protein Csm1